MEIGEPVKTIQVEPLELPEPLRADPQPKEQPVHEPDTVKVGNE